ncbi:universal stress protein [Salinicola rhizosphaerae]|uniref:Universal stress protein n=1 Tax=Salinicola rhizosphaerae TaxID=1443141 RepID=A0ABQ3DWF6_9GAMM|nr:universal stress protein [Salinicola rhizosphaerae]GHB16174.1 universal stress protein [Salinicola rhizosphaerae]
MSERHVLACIDDSPHALGVCAAAGWAAGRLGAPLELMHVLGKTTTVENRDASGQIGLGSREHLREQLTELDAQRARLAQQHGRELLEAASAQVRRSQGEIAVETALRHGDLIESLVAREAQTRLVVLGKRGESAEEAQAHLGSNLERVVRTLQTPILVTPARFEAPTRLLLAFDGSRTTRKGVEMIADSPLLNGLVCHVVMVGAGTDDQRAQLGWALDRLRDGQVQAEGEIVAGEVDEVLADYAQQHAIDLTIMGAYGHSRIRQLLVGSTTTAMLRQTSTAVLVLR